MQKGERTICFADKRLDLVCVLYYPQTRLYDAENIMYNENNMNHLPAGQDERKKKAVKPSHGNFKENGAVYLYLEQQLYTHPDLRTALSVHHEHHQHGAAPLRH